MNDIITKVRENSQKMVKVAISDIDGILRGKYLAKDKFLQSIESGFGFCDVVFGWDSSDKSYDNSQFTGWHSGYPDAKALIDVNSHRRNPLNEGDFFLADFPEIDICPRTLMKKAEKKANAMGFRPYLSQEYEWFNFFKNEEKPTPITKGMFGYSLIRMAQNNQFFDDIFNHMEEFGIPLEGLHTETGPGVYEAAIKYTTALEAADRAVIFKTFVKEIATKYDITPSFMAKWSKDYPGCSGHIHQSLWDIDGKENLFYGMDGDRGMSEIMESYLAGQLHCLPEILPMYAPNINSYKRLVEGAWAPTSASWGHDNRTSAFRVIAGSKNAIRIESRVTGSDVNPYLAMSASLLSGLYGIEKKLKLERDPIQGSAYQDKTQRPLSKNLWDATLKMEKSSLPCELFGEKFVRHFVDTRKWEWREFQNEITDYELERYFEII